MLAPNFGFSAGCCFNPEQGICQAVIFVWTCRRRLFSEKTCRKAVNNNWL